MTEGTINLFDTAPAKPAEGIFVTPTAAAKVKELLEAEGRTGHGLRLAVTAGGCSGYNYGLHFEESASPGDQVFPADGFDVFVDPRSYALLRGTRIDYSDSIQGAGFKIENPNATAACGCGKSFTA